MDKKELLESTEPKVLREILATKPFLSESFLACYLSVPTGEGLQPDERITYRVLVLEEAWIHLIYIHFSRPWKPSDRGQPVIRYSIGTDAVKSIETSWEAPDTFEDVDNALEISDCRATILLERELGDIGNHGS